MIDIRIYIYLFGDHDPDYPLWPGLWHHLVRWEYLFFFLILLGITWWCEKNSSEWAPESNRLLNLHLPKRIFKLAKLTFRQTPLEMAKDVMFVLFFCCFFLLQYSSSSSYSSIFSSSFTSSYLDSYSYVSSY